jgi:hypothetical protein
MPPLATAAVDPTGSKLVAAWIDALTSPTGRGAEP